MQIVCPGRVTSLTTTPDGNYCIAAVSENIHIWQVQYINIKLFIGSHKGYLGMTEFY